MRLILLQLGKRPSNSDRFPSQLRMIAKHVQMAKYAIEQKPYRFPWPSHVTAARVPVATRAIEHKPDRFPWPTWIVMSIVYIVKQSS